MCNVSSGIANRELKCHFTDTSKTEYLPDKDKPIKLLFLDTFTIIMCQFSRISSASVLPEPG